MINTTNNKQNLCNELFAKITQYLRTKKINDYEFDNVIIDTYYCLNEFEINIFIVFKNNENKISYSVLNKIRSDYDNKDLDMFIEKVKKQFKKHLISKGLELVNNK